ncbi:hypothetical protein FKM82_017570 [Ascaphus truei]
MGGSHSLIGCPVIEATPFTVLEGAATAFAPLTPTGWGSFFGTNPGQLSATFANAVFSSTSPRGLQGKREPPSWFAFPITLATEVAFCIAPTGWQADPTFPPPTITMSSSLSSGVILRGPRQDQNGAATALAPLHSRLVKVISVACSSPAHTPCALSPLTSVRHLGPSAPRGSSILAVAILSLYLELLYMELLSAGQLPHRYNKDYLDAPPCVPNVGWTRVCTTSG